MQMQKIIFSHGKQRVAEFAVDTLEVAQRTEGLLLTASGEMVFQDTPLVEEAARQATNMHVHITKDGETVLDQAFQVTFFALEAEMVVALLQ